MEYHEEFIIEQHYLEKTCYFIKQKLDQELNAISSEKDQIIDARKDMWENVSFKGGFNNAAEANQVLESIQTKAASYDASHRRIDKLTKSMESPYFARVDFAETGYGSDSEMIYIGLSTIMDEDTYYPYVYDWRAPIASIFYRYEVGSVAYEAPSGTINGTVSLKRQYEIQNGKLNYFFDSDVNIMDEMLRVALSRNTSQKMKNIVETIQRQQDMIIRDTQNEVLIVQGVAGSGKTSVALHRVAFMLYEGVAEKLSANNILILSPNTLFGSYISNVLPELGEENIASLTFEGLFYKTFTESLELVPRNNLLEAMVSAGKKQRDFLHQLVELKSSKQFALILERYVTHFTRRMISFTDIYYNGKLIMSREEMKSFLLCSNRNLPPCKSLELIEKRIWTAIHKERESRLPKLQGFISTYKEHLYDNKQFSRLISIKEAIRIKRQIRSFLDVDPIDLYQRLLKDSDLFTKLSKGLQLPGGVEELLNYSSQQLQKLKSQPLPYEDALPLLYLDLQLNGCNLFNNIRQVVVDEAQDYYPIHFEVLKRLFPNARYTIMGDSNQMIEKTASPSLYEDIIKILNKTNSNIITLGKGFRCSAEINKFSRRFLEDDSNFESFDRHEEEPVVLGCENQDIMCQLILDTIIQYQESGLSSIGIICKSAQEAQKIYLQIKHRTKVVLLDSNKPELFSGVMLMPVYTAKGLEFDGAILCGADDANYHTPFDKKLLYVSCTRALHRLTVLHIGKPSRFLNN